jgi:hypothetical protein
MLLTDSKYEKYVMISETKAFQGWRGKLVLKWILSMCHLFPNSEIRGNGRPLQTGDGKHPDNMMTRMKISTFTSGIRFHESKNMGMSSLMMT